MNILETVNHFWPNTIAKLALAQEHLPDGVPFMGAFVELFEGAVLPSEAEVKAKLGEYEAYLTTQAEVQTIKHQIAALEAQQTPRRVREALLGDDGWLAGVDEQITALRAQLST